MSAQLYMMFVMCVAITVLELSFGTMKNTLETILFCCSFSGLDIIYRRRYASVPSTFR